MVHFSYLWSKLFLQTQRKITMRYNVPNREKQAYSESKLQKLSIFLNLFSKIKKKMKKPPQEISARWLLPCTLTFVCDSYVVCQYSLHRVSFTADLAKVRLLTSMDSSHVNCLLSILTCLLKVSVLAIPFPQVLHGYGFSPVWGFMSLRI